MQFQKTVNNTAVYEKSNSQKQLCNKIIWYNDCKKDCVMILLRMTDRQIWTVLYKASSYQSGGLIDGEIIESGSPQCVTHLPMWDL